MNMNTINRKEIMAYLRTLKPQLREIGIDRIGLFGSVAKGEDDLLSDIDIMIHTTPEFVKRFEGIEGFIYLDDLRKHISYRFGRSVDLCDEAGLKKKIGDVLYA